MASPKIHFRANSRLFNWFLFVPSVVQLMIIFIESYIVFLYPHEFLNHGSKMGMFTDFIQVYGMLFAGIVQIVENLLKGNLDQIINDSIEAFDQEIFAKHACRNPHYCSFHRQRSLLPFLIDRLFYFLFVTFVFDVAVILTISNEDRVWRQSICVREFTVNTIRIGMVYAVFHFYWVNNISNSLQFSS